MDLVLLQHWINEHLIVCNNVSILILMDLVLLLSKLLALASASASFNPYFNGSSTSTVVESGVLSPKTTRFNPYFNGSSTSTVSYHFTLVYRPKFQSLF